MMAPPTPSPRILVVDDDPGLREVLVYYLGQQGFEAKAPTHQQSPGADRSAELVGADRQQVGAGGGEVDRDMADGLGGVHVEQHVTRPACVGDGLHVMDGPHLVVSPLQVDDACVVGYGRDQLVGIDAAGPVDANQRHRTPLGTAPDG